MFHKCEIPGSGLVFIAHTLINRSNRKSNLQKLPILLQVTLHYLHEGDGVDVIGFQMSQESAECPLVTEVFNVRIVALDVVGVVLVDAEKLSKTFKQKFQSVE